MIYEIVVDMCIYSSCNVLFGNSRIGYVPTVICMS